MNQNLLQKVFNVLKDREKEYPAFDTSIGEIFRDAVQIIDGPPTDQKDLFNQLERIKKQIVSVNINIPANLSQTTTMELSSLQEKLREINLFSRGLLIMEQEDFLLFALQRSICYYLRYLLSRKRDQLAQSIMDLSNTSLVILNYEQWKILQKTEKQMAKEAHLFYQINKLPTSEILKPFLDAIEELDLLENDYISQKMDDRFFKTEVLYRTIGPKDIHPSQIQSAPIFDSFFFDKFL